MFSVLADPLVWKDYNPKYPEIAKKEAHKVEEILRKIDKLCEVDGKTHHHVGSTAIVGMPGKPIIDIAVCSKNLLPNLPEEFI